MPRISNRTAYCQQQAAQCASAAIATTLNEIREAYLNMEQAWLHLAPDVDGNQPAAISSKSDEQQESFESGRSYTRGV